MGFAARSLITNNSTNGRSMPGPMPALPYEKPNTIVAADVAPPISGRSHARIWLAVAVIVIAAIGAVGAYSYYHSPSAALSIHITSLSVSSGDNACDLNGRAFPGFSATGSEWVAETLAVVNGYAHSCTINAVSTTTAGFDLLYQNTPLTIPGAGTADLTFTVSTPTQSYTGILTINIE